MLISLIIHTSRICIRRADVPGFRREPPQSRTGAMSRLLHCFRYCDYRNIWFQANRALVVGGAVAGCCGWVACS